MIKTTGVGESSCLIRNIKNMLERWSSCRNSSLCSCEREFYYMFPSFGLEINESGESRVSSSDFISNAVHTINANIANNIIPTPLYTPQHTLSTLKYIKFNKIIALWPGLNFICTLSATRFRFYSKYTHFYLIKSTVQVWQYSQATTFAYLNWIVHLTRVKVRTTTGGQWW